MSEKMATPEKAPFKLFHAEWLKKSAEKLKEKPWFPKVAGLTAAGLGSGLLLALGLLSPLAFVGASAAVIAGFSDSAKMKKSPEKK